jgi:hypothetical protein
MNNLITNNQLPACTEFIEVLPFTNHQNAEHTTHYALRISGIGYRLSAVGLPKAEVSSIGNRASSIEIMQNKANFPKNRAIVNACKTEDYENAPSFLAQFSQSQFWPTVSSCKLEDYKNAPPFLA